ncbi:2214_t:CDS:2 [Cetraspora pellucida]|uniref:2214_t:CDS:1 n=1 Tax=Cetraspora pellucida TaxID=1433469 RepID=A0ACA9JXS8_9GLOM|nr:2214_t:CDS:2 [Cetraspora pellucida]
MSNCSDPFNENPANTTALKWLESAISSNHINYFNYNEFTEIKLLSGTTTSTVFRSNWNRGLTVALKSLRFDTEGKDMKSFVKELQLLQRVGFHPRVNQFYGVTKDPSSEYYTLVLQSIDEYLQDYLSRNFSKLNWAKKLSIAIEIAEGIKYLHDNEIAHLDLHTRNVVVCGGKMLIVGFGIPENPSVSTSKTFEKPAYIDPYFLPLALESEISFVQSLVVQSSLELVSLVEKINNLIYNKAQKKMITPNDRVNENEEYKKNFYVDGESLFCTFFKCILNYKNKFILDQHLRTDKHKTNKFKVKENP